MKKYLIVLLVLFACNLMSTDVRIVWNSNPNDEKVQHYNVYKVEANDTINSNLVLIGTVLHDTSLAELYFVTSFDSLYIRAGIEAVRGDSISGRPETKWYDDNDIKLPLSDPSFASFPIIRN